MSGAPSRYERVRARKAGREDALASRPVNTSDMPSLRAMGIYIKAYTLASIRFRQDFKTIC